MDASDLPKREELLRLLDRTRPRIEDILRRHGIAAGDAEALVDEARTALLHHWDRVAHREWWLLDRIEKAIRRCKDRSPEEPAHAQEKAD